MIHAPTSRERIIMFESMCAARLRTPITVFVLVSVMAAPSFAQSDRLSMTLRMPETDGFADQARTGYRSYVELDVFKFEVWLMNETTVPVVVDQRTLRQAFTTRVRMDADLPVALRWLAVDRGEADRPTISSDEPVLIDAGKAVRWTFAIQREDRLAFWWGEYVVHLAVGDLRPAVGGAWGGRLPEPGTYVRWVWVQAPRTPHELSRRWATVAEAARERRDYETALEAMLQASGADPLLEDALPQLYLETARYKEAIARYQRLIARQSRRDNTTMWFLAQAYVGVGDERKAAELLLENGIPAGSMAAELTRIRDLVFERARENRR